ncbi:MAG: MFS transporter [Candidatus Parvarchaeota archaeon]|nr:MFS transporter [Candidatus Jingweiarchaeum tengchongense]MCW1298077.1 MFS transporter [Candidatus Jingweiarchaeum tengchongense]MCW1300123.1 MFS transporter [Candidatus Jingweiarchaeum tengchongense]MCW1309627.1 MFS transporter [Candidatus Jingweiarchaeum tengchongense]MCW1310885.1 MFS transporter [Candidatus Jingweiarchaeum tengchongense]
MSKKEKKLVLTLSLASFLNDLGSDMIYPIWPLFLTSVLNANMQILGLIDGLGDALVNLSQGLSGYISDRIKKRKIFVWTGYLCGSIARIGYAISKTWVHILPFKILDRVGKIRGAPRDAMIADASTRSDRGRNFGFLRMMDNLGAVSGIVACILLFGILGYRNLFLIAAIPSIISALLVFLYVKEKRIRRGTKTKFYIKSLNKEYKLFLILSCIFALGSFSYSFLLIYAKELGFNILTIPIFYLIFNVVASIMSLPFGKFADKFNRKIVLTLSYLLFAIMCIGFTFINSFLGVSFLFVLYGLHKASIEPVQRAFVSELSPKEYRASALGIFQMSTGFCALPASLIAGFLWEKVHIFAPLYFSSVLSIAALLILSFVKEQ